MKNIKKLSYWAVALLALASCTPNHPSGDSGSAANSASSGAQSQNSQVSEDVATPWSDYSPVTTGKWLEVSLGKSTIPAGASFYDACHPEVIYHDGTKDTDVTDQSFKTTYQILLASDTRVSYGAGDALPAGDYVATVRYSSSGYHNNYIHFKVEAGTVEENAGYTQATLDSLKKYQIQNYDGIETLGGNGMPALGNVKLLVIPVQFQNESAQFSDATLVHDTLEEAFFAESEDTPWESLHSYYKKASYGKLNITGTVTPIYTYPAADTSFDSSNSGASATVIQAAVASLVASGTINASDYDANGDGYIDGIEVVYATSQGVPGGSSDDSSNSLWWNFTMNVSGAKSTTNPGPHRVFWSRWDYVTNSYYASDKKADGTVLGNRVDGKAVDAHTIIHETGHMMGIPDYYSYAHQEGVAGCVDMMDQNVGDHNAYSKMCYGWAAPKVIDGSSKNFMITLNSFADTGDFILLRNTTTDPWNGSPYDEYTILQYYTPTGVNEKDSTGYPEWSNAASSNGGSAYGHGGTYAHPGLMAFHVDSRVGAYTATLGDDGKIVSSSRKLGYTDNIYSSEKYDTANKTYESAASLYASNTGADANGNALSGRTGQYIDANGKLQYTTKKAYRLFKAITPSGNDSFASSSYYSTMGQMANIFGTKEYNETWGDPTSDKADDKYGGSNYSNYKMRSLYVDDLYFDDGSQLNYDWEITSQTDSSVTIHFVDTSL